MTTTRAFFLQIRAPIFEKGQWRRPTLPSASSYVPVFPFFNDIITNEIRTTPVGVLIYSNNFVIE